MPEFRWSQLAGSEDGLFETTRRVVGRGEYRGLTFHEIEARSILTKSPPGTPWFAYSINAYRGCSHACVYCLAGETPILMADGRTKPIASVRPGDRVYGTQREGSYRRLVEAEVLDHWSTVKPAFRVVAGPDTVLVASGDHRFLTDRGWKHVTGAQQGADQRPHLTQDDKLIGLDPLAESSLETDLVAVDLKDVQDLKTELPMYDITTTSGDFIANEVVSHNCFARPTHDYLGFNMGSEFDSQIVVKTNAVDLVRAETMPGRWPGESIAMGTNTDPYQAAEGKYKLTRGIIEVLAERRNPFSILTKSPLVLRDLDLISEASRQTEVSVSFSVATVDEDVWRRTEPGAPHPRRRLEALAKLRAAGISGGVMMAPIIPGISDRPEQIAAVQQAAKEAGAESWHPVKLHLRGMRKHFLDWLADDSPELVEQYEDMYPERRPRPPQRKASSADPAQLSLL
jgi:DNA repair photolyase